MVIKIADDRTQQQLRNTITCLTDFSMFKMADHVVVLLSPLCFLLEKFDSGQAKLIRSALADFYDADAITAAKLRLLEDISRMDLSVKPPHVPAKRCGENHTVQDVEDIITLFKFLDENLLLSKLPEYVSKGPNSMPTLRVYEGDLKIFLARLDKLEARLVELGDIMAMAVQMQRDMQREMQSLFTCHPAFNSASHLRPAGQESVINNASRTNNAETHTVTLGNYPITTPTANTMSHAHDAQSQYKHGEQPPLNDTRQQNNFIDMSSMSQHNSISWADSVVTSAVTLENRYAVLSQSATDDEHTHAESADETPFTRYQSNETRRKRRRVQSSQQKTPTPTGTHENGVNFVSNAPNRTFASVASTGTTDMPAKVRKAPLIIGKSQLVDNFTVHPLKAAKQITKKAVFCIDNLSVDCTVTDIVSFIQNLSIDVLTCYQTMSRRRRSDGEKTNSDINAERRAFRVCIKDSDRERLLNESIWPEHVTISEWIFNLKSRKNDEHRSEQQVNGKYH